MMDIKEMIKSLELEGQKLIFDTHAHYDDERFNEDRDSLLKELHRDLVINILNAGTNLNTSQDSVSLANSYDFISAAVGIHPFYANDLPADYIDIVCKYSKDKKVVAIGEIGLDYHYEDYNKNLQVKIFEDQLKLANDLNLPVIIHERDAHLDTLNLLKKYKPKGVVHCFSGSLELANEIISLGMYIGLGGVVTFKNAVKTVKVAQEIPIDRILLETDAPYMAPTPFRGKRCDSSMILYTAAKIAEIRNIKTADLLKQTLHNAKSLFFN